MRRRGSEPTSTSEADPETSGTVRGGELGIAASGPPGGDDGERAVPGTGGVHVPARSSPPATSTDGVQPTEQELRISARLLLYIARQPRPAPGEIPPESLTQGEMATALGTSQAAVSNALGRLVDGGALRVERSHVRRKLLRLKVYQLTPQGEEIVRQIHRRFGL